MNQLLKTFIVCVVLFNAIETKSTVDHKSAKRMKRFVGGLGADFDYYAAFMDYSAYDYYDWVCTEGLCQLCDVLTGDCCNPNMDRNCFMPDSCINNPCLSGGTCVGTRTIDNRPDFSCICNYGLTGKYCQLVDEFSPRVLPVVPVPAPIPPPIVGGGGAAGGKEESGGTKVEATTAAYAAPAYPAPAPATYQAPAQQYQAPVQQQQQQQYQAPVQQQQYQEPVQQYQAPVQQQQYQAPVQQQQQYQAPVQQQQYQEPVQQYQQAAPVQQQQQYQAPVQQQQQPLQSSVQY